MIAAHDWAHTPLGARDRWPEPLKFSVDLMLGSGAQMVMFVGDEFIAIYNDAYAPAIGNKHPHALGNPASRHWAELWTDLEPLLVGVKRSGKTFAAKDRPFYIERFGYPETVYFDVSFSPVRGSDGQVLAVLCVVAETTGRVRALQAALPGQVLRRDQVFTSDAGLVAAGGGQVQIALDHFGGDLGMSVPIVHSSGFDSVIPSETVQAQRRLPDPGERGGGRIGQIHIQPKHGKPAWIGSSAGSVFGRIAPVEREDHGAVERRRAEADVRHLASIVESSDDAIFSIDLQMRIISWNPGAERLYGYGRDQAIGMSILKLVPEDRHDEESAIIARIRNGERVQAHETVRLTREGQGVEVSLSASPIFDEDGEVIGVSKIARDIAARKANERLQQTLLNEMKHRVKNIVTTIHSISRQTFRGTDYPEAQTFNDRLHALSRAQDLITREALDGVRLGDLIAEVMAPYPADRLTCSGPALVLAAKSALTFTLALHELATNAAKYGALQGQTGTVDVHWSVETEDDALCFRLDWIEKTPTARPPRQKDGFGTRLITDLITFEFSGRTDLDFRPEGLICRIEAPVRNGWLRLA